MNQITQQQRYSIETLHRENYTQTAIAQRLGIHKSSVCRQLARNSIKGTYQAQKAHKTAISRCKRDPYKLKGTLLDLVKKQLKQQHSPEQISGRLDQEQVAITSSHETIYQWIYTDKKHGGAWYIHLRRAHKKRRKRLSRKDRRGIIPNKVMIAQRPPEVAAKSRLGDYEGDTIIGANHQGAIVTLVDRVSKTTLMAKVATKSAALVSKAIIGLLKRAPIKAKTLTVDNGTEFTEHQKIAKAVNCEVFFANPYHSWERGLNENTNGLIRQYIPKKTAFNQVSHHQVRAIERTLNNRPRKTLNYLSPNEFIQQYQT